MTTPLEKTLLSLTALVASARRGMGTHSDRHIAEWLADKLIEEADTLDYELCHGEYSEIKQHDHL